MSTLLQLLANYYNSVLESERIYHENVACSSSVPCPSLQREPSPKVEQEMLLLQRQVHQLTSEVQVLHRENDTLKELQKTQRALMESKVNNSKKTIEKLRKQLNEPDRKESNNATPPPTQLKKRKLHLLSPLTGRKLEGVGVSQISKNSNGSMGLRRALSSGQHTLFDDHDIGNQTLDHIADINFIDSIKNREKLLQIELPTNALSDNEEAQRKPSTKIGKKRRLARKPIQKLNNDSD